MRRYLVRPLREQMRWRDQQDHIRTIIYAALSLLNCRLTLPINACSAAEQAFMGKVRRAVANHGRPIEK